MLKQHWHLLALAPLLAAPAWAAGHGQEAPSSITVQGGQETVSQWSERVGQSLDAVLVYPKPLGTANYSQGLAKVSFHCTEDGRPGDVALIASSGSRDLDRAAMQAVQRIRTLHPLPVGITHTRPMQAWIAFAPDEDSLKQMTRVTHREAELANARVEKARQSQQVARASAPALIIAAN